MRRILLIRMTNRQTRKHQPTRMMVRVLKAVVIMMNKFNWARRISLAALRFLSSACRTTTAAQYCKNPCSTYMIFHTPHHTRQSYFFVPHPFQRANAEKYLEVYCTTAEAHLATGNNSLTITLDELNKFMGQIVIGGKTLPIKSMWDKSWGCHLFKATKLL